MKTTLKALIDIIPRGSASGSNKQSSSRMRGSKWKISVFDLLGQNETSEIPRQLFLGDSWFREIFYYQT